MIFGNGRSCFEFYHDYIFDNQVSEVFANDLTLVINRNLSLRNNLQPHLLEFDDHRVAINFFQKSVTQGIVNVIEGLDNLL
jgi:hypothetical protein